MRISSLFAVLAIAIPGWFAARPAAAASPDWYTGTTPLRPEDDWIVAVNASVDITSQGSRFADLNATMAPAGTLKETGWRVRADALGGVYSYQSTQTGTAVHGTQESGALLTGYEWIAPGVSVAAYIGGDARHDGLSVTDPGNPVVGSSVGLKSSLEFAARPTASTLVTGYGSFETNKSAYFARLRGGVLMGSGLYVGPEVVALGDAFFNQQRMGAYIGGAKLGGIQFALSSGYLYDRVRKGGAYVSLDARTGF